MQESEIRANFSKNIRDLRQSRKLNQIQLGEKINYSSKAVSKWENGDVIPEIATLKMLADFFDITVDDLISNRNVVRKSHKKRNRFLITVVSALLSFFVAAIVFLILSLVQIDKSWLSFIVAIPTSAIVLITFSSLWYHRLQIMLSTIYLIVGAWLTTVLFTNFNLWWIYLIAASILIVLSVIFFSIKFTNRVK